MTFHYGYLILVCIGIGYLLIQKRKKMGDEVPPCFKPIDDESNKPHGAVFTVEQLKKTNNKELLNIPGNLLTL